MGAAAASPACRVRRRPESSQCLCNRERWCPRVLAPVIESKQKVQIVVLGELRLGMKLLANLQQKVCECNQSRPLPDSPFHSICAGNYVPSRDNGIFSHHSTGWYPQVFITPFHFYGTIFRLLFITAVPYTKLCAWGGRIVEDMCYEIRRAEACVD